MSSYPTAFRTPAKGVCRANRALSDSVLAPGFRQSAFPTSNLPTRRSLFRIHNLFSIRFYLVWKTRRYGTDEFPSVSLNPPNFWEFSQITYVFFGSSFTSITQVFLSARYFGFPIICGNESFDICDQDQLPSIISLLKVTLICFVVVASIFMSPDSGTVLTTDGGKDLTEASCPQASPAASNTKHTDTVINLLMFALLSSNVTAHLREASSEAGCSLSFVHRRCHVAKSKSFESFVSCHTQYEILASIWETPVYTASTRFSEPPSPFE